jgi:cytochrome c-type biogenesis protein CcmE
MQFRHADLSLRHCKARIFLSCRDRVGQIAQHQESAQGIRPMTRKQKRLSVILGCLAIAGFAVFLMLNAMRDSIVFFYTPSDIAEKAVSPGTRIRLGGMVVVGSWKKSPPSRHDFEITDTLKTLQVTYDGFVPDLFREGQGVVAEGALDAAGNFKADTVLAKHDENYMPKEIADSLKERGVKLGKTGQ